MAAFSRAVVRPVAACMLPVMILTLVAALEGLPILPYVIWAAGGALLIASLWTSFGLRRRIAEIRVDDEWAYVRSVSDVVSDRHGRSERVIDVRDYGTWASVTIGLTTYELDGSSWLNFDGLLEALRRAWTSWQMQ